MSDSINKVFNLASGSAEGAVQVRDGAQELSRQAEDLYSLVNQFKV